MRPTWPLVGRSEELDLVEGALTRSETGGVVLGGAPGVGKTRLAKEVLSLLESVGYGVEWAVATLSASMIPYGALAHLLPEELVDGEQAGTPAGTANVLRAAAEALVSRAGKGERLALGVDDAHLLDASSAALVHQLVATDAAFLVAAVRSGEPAPDAVVGLWKDGLVERIDVQPLSRLETDRLVETALGSQVEGTTLYRLWDATRGNPLLLRELVLGGLRSGSLSETDGVWQWNGPFSPAPRLMDLLEARLGRLDDVERNALEIVAEAEFLSSGVLQRLADRTIVEALERRGLLESWREGRRIQVRTAHPLYAEAVRGKTPLSRNRSIRKALADAVDSWGARRREDLLRQATWRLDAGEALSPDVALAAARRAASTADYELAEQLARASLGAGGGFEATHALVEALTGQGRFAEVEDLLRGVEDQSQPEPVRAMSAVVRATNLLWRLGDGEAAWDALRRAEESVADPHLRDELAATRATFLVYGGQTKQGIEVGLDVVERAISDRAVAHAVPVVWALLLSARTRQALAFIERVREPVDRVVEEFPLMPDWLGNNVFAARFFDGDLEAAAAGMESRYRRTSEQGSWERAVARWALGWIERTRGRVRTARRRLEEATLLLRQVDMLNQLPICLAEMAHVEALLGRVDEAEATLAEAQRSRLPALRHGEAHIGLAQTWVAAARGEISHAIEQALRTAEATGQMDQVVHQAAALHDAARLGAAAQVAGQLDFLAERADGRMIPTYAEHARALADCDAQALENVSSDFEDMGALLYAAEALAEAARIHREHGRTGSALTASARASRLADACQGARTPALENFTVPLPLTRREREVASLAAQGLSNSDIADRLVISLRTVENHLHAVYTKLGIAGRHELAPILTGEQPGAATRT